jgi:YD repeat-containing protein
MKVQIGPGVNDNVTNNNGGDFYDNGDIAIPNQNDQATWEYKYDKNGNLTEDKNKGLFSILYNQLNLPISISKSDGSRLEYIYDASGTK